MDTLSHGLWGTIAFGKENKRDALASFAFGVAPDIFSFGIYLAGTWVGLYPRPDFGEGRHPDPSMIPSFVHVAYDYTHSLVIFAVVFLLVAMFRRGKLYWPMAAWGLHILVDIPTHALSFFPTPFLFPFSDYRFPGVSWGHPLIFYPNWIAILVCLFVFFVWPWWKKYRGKKPENV